MIWAQLSPKKTSKNGSSPSGLDNTVEATAWENGFVPEGSGLAAVDLEKRIMSSLPHIVYMVSRPMQPTIAGESTLRRQDAAPWPSWFRDWQSDFGGFTKVYEHKKGDEVKSSSHT